MNVESFTRHRFDPSDVLSHSIETITLHSNREHPLSYHPFYQTLTLSHLPSVIQISNPLRYWWCWWWDEGRDVLAVIVRRIVCLIN